MVFKNNTIVAPSQVPWGQKAFAGYLGGDIQDWAQHDACALVFGAQNPQKNATILIDQGLDDPFLEEQLKPNLFEAACLRVGQKLDLHFHAGYDHSYYFIQSFISDHIDHHSQVLNTCSKA